MSEEHPHVENELEDHKTEITTWISSVSILPIPPSRKGVIERFIRDCQTLITDCSGNQEPSAADLCDLHDRKNSLEIQYLNITEDLA